MAVRIIHGECRTALRTLPDESVNTVITSPPYYGLRTYRTEPAIWGGLPECDHSWADEVRLTGRGSGFQGKNGERALRAMPEQRETIRERGAFCAECGAWRGELGLEPAYQLYVEHIVEVFREVWRVLRRDGTLWMNLGDTYATGGGLVGRCPGGGKQGENWGLRGVTTQPNRMPQPGLKPKDLCGIPWRCALALQADGWWLRQEVIWHKPNPMPSSAVDRCTLAHEQVFMLAKNGDLSLLWRHKLTGQWVYEQPAPDYLWRNRKTLAESREPRTGDGWYRVNLWVGFDYFYDQESISEPCSPNTHARLAQDVQEQLGSARANGGARPNGNMKAVNGAFRTPTAWDTDVTGARHGAFHREGRRKRAAAGSGIKNNDSMDAALAIMPDRRNKRSVWTIAPESYDGAHFATFAPALVEPCVLAGCPEGGTVLDPFFGSGTVGLVADRLKRNCIGVDLNQEYVAMAERRIRGDASLLSEVAVT